MAGLGRKEFDSGDILLASEVQGYLQDQAVMVFDDAAARGSAIATPSEGMLTYNKDTEALELYDGSAFGPVGSDAGLIHIETRAVSASSSESFNNVFTSSYDNYKILVSLVAASGSPELRYRFRASGTDNSTTNYQFQRFSGQGSLVTAARSSSQNYAWIGNVSSRECNFVLEVFNPQRAVDTSIASSNNVTSDSVFFLFTGFYGNNLFDGLSLFPSSSSVTGTISIYGYRKS